MSENSGWLPPTSGGDRDARPQEEPPAPRYGAYGSAPAGSPSYGSYGSEDPGQQGTGYAGADYQGASYPGGLPSQGGWGGPSASAPYAQGAGAPGGFFLAPKPGISRCDRWGSPRSSAAPSTPSERTRAPCSCRPSSS